MAIFVPEVFANAVNEKLGTALKFGHVAFDATEFAPEILVAGEKVHFPKLKRTANVQTVVKGTDLVPATIDMTDDTAEIKYTASPFRVYDSERAQIKGRVYDEVVQQVVDAMALDIDSSLSTACLADAVYVSPAAAADAITSAELQTGMDNFGDNVDTDTFGGIMINSRLRSSFMAMPEFVDAAKTYQTDGNGITTNGVIGWYYGIPVVLTNNGTWDSTKLETVTYLLKKNALGYIFQKQVTVEEARALLALATDVVASSLYATKLIDETGLVVIRKTVA